MTTKYEQYSAERKTQQLAGTLPDFYSTAGFQLISEKEYVGKHETVKDRYETIARTLSNHLPYKFREKYNTIFFNLLWDGLLSASTPVYINTGTQDKGLPISCSGSFILDSVDSFYKVAHEIAMLSKLGFGTSVYLGDIRPRGSQIKGGGKSDGVVPVMELMFNVANHISQGNNRRGSVATYLPLSHPDFWEVCHFLENNSDGSNMGWVIGDAEIALLDNADEEMTDRYQEVLYLRMLGMGYIVDVDKANRLAPDVYKENNIRIFASNLCSEIFLHSSEKYTFTCCLSSLNLVNWDKILENDGQAIFDSIIFLDCVNSEFIEKSKGIPGVEKARAFAEWSRPVGLGAMGLSTYMQSKSVVFDDMEGHLLNTGIFKKIRQKADEANKWLGENLGEPELMKGTGLRCSHVMAIAPTLSTAVVMGGVSNGVEPSFANIYTQETSAGEVRRANPEVVKLLKSKGKWNKEVIQSIIGNSGSVSHLEFLSEHEKAVFRTAFEVDQMAIVRMANARGQRVDQGQSINLFFSSEAEEEYVSSVHMEALKSEYVKGLYYIRSSSGVNARTSLTDNECEMCSG